MSIDAPLSRRQLMILLAGAVAAPAALEAREALRNTVLPPAEGRSFEREPPVGYRIQRSAGFARDGVLVGAIPTGIP